MTGFRRTSNWQAVRPGDRLWVREGWRWNVDYHTPVYRIDYPDGEDPPVPDAFYRWRSPIHLARADSRLTLIVTALKIERLRDISNDDAEAEGIESQLWDQAVGYRNYAEKDGWFCTWPGVGIMAAPDQIQRLSFCSLWQSLHGPESWSANPEVVALTFTVHKQNIDAMPKAVAA